MIITKLATDLLFLQYMLFQMIRYVVITICALKIYSNYTVKVEQERLGMLH